MNRYINKHVSVSFSMRDVLKQESIEKSVEQLDITDYQNWFVDLVFEKGRGLDGIDENGQKLSSEFMHNLLAGMWKTRYKCFKK